jgi:hypothetical protein
VKNLRRISGSLAVLVLPPAAILLALWLPFGFSMTGLIEEWDLLGLFVEHGVFFFVHRDGPVAAHGARPLMPLGFALAYVLDPDSFDGAHWLTIAALLIKGAAMTVLAARATGSRAWGVVAGGAIILYPADTMQLSFRSLHINLAIAFALAGCALLIKALDFRSTWRSLAVALVASLLYFGSLLTYEAALMLVALPVAILFARDGVHRFAKFEPRQIAVMSLWIASGAIYVGYALWISRQIASYQNQVTGDPASLIATVQSALPKLVTVGASRALLGGWIDAAGMLVTEISNPFYVLTAACAIAAVGLTAIRLEVGRRASPVDDSLAIAPWARPGRLAIVGVLLMLLGYAPFLASPAHVAISQRTFLWATPGAVFVFVGLLAGLWRLARPLAATAIFGLLILGLAAQLFQFHHYVGLSQRQRILLKAIVENFDPEIAGQTLLVLDESAQLGHTWMFANESLHYALTYLYGKPFGPFEVCGMPGKEWQRVGQLGRKGRCVEGETEWTFAFPPDPSKPGIAGEATAGARRVAKNDLTVVAIAEDGTVSTRPTAARSQNPGQVGEAAIVRRHRWVLQSGSATRVWQMFRDQAASNRYRWDFGRWWSLEMPPRGGGWFEAEWIGNGLSHRSMAWTMSSTADLRFELAPKPESYLLDGEFDYLSDGARRGLGLRLNGESLALRWTSALRFEADVRTGLILPGFNKIEFHSDPDDTGPGHARLDWVSVAPR